jgi:hypothetical protein
MGSGENHGLSIIFKRCIFPIFCVFFPMWFLEVNSKIKGTGTIFVVHCVKPLKIQVYDNNRGNEYHTALRGAGHPAPGKTENDRE